MGETVHPGVSAFDAIDTQLLVENIWHRRYEPRISEWAALIDELGRLKDRERRVLVERFRVPDGTPLATIGDQLGITREGARAIERRVLLRLRRAVGAPGAWDDRRDYQALPLARPRPEEEDGEGDGEDG